jgi:hypothetical protein
MSDFTYQVVQQAIGLPPEIDERKLDFLLGEVRDGPVAAKSAQRGEDFIQRLGYNRTQLRLLLEKQIILPSLQERVRINQFGGPILNLRNRIEGTTGITAQLVSSWEITAKSLRLITAWAEIER